MRSGFTLAVCRRRSRSSSSSRSRSARSACSSGSPWPPALHQLSEALNEHGAAAAAGHSTGIRHDLLAWVDRQLRELPHGSKLLHPIAAYGHKATSAVVATFFTLAATWYWVSERDRMIELLAAITPESKREPGRPTSRSTVNSARTRG